MTNVGPAVSAVLALALVGVGVAAPATARDDDRREVKLEGNCSGRSDWKLSAKARDGAVEVEFEVESTRGRRPPWRVTIAQNGAQLTSGVRRARARSGQFAVERRAAGTWPSTITAHAQNLRSGEICLATARI